MIERVKAAFADVTYPGDDALTDSTYGEEPAALVDEFTGKDDWAALDPDFLDQAPDGWSSALSFFSGPALRFYLPAYLIADLRGELMRADPSFRLSWGVTPAGDAKKIAKQWGGGTIGERAREDFAPFTPEQVAVIVDYLWWKLEESPAPDPTIEAALQGYWLERVEREK